MTALTSLRQKGFTLVELLIVIAIIGVLAVVVLLAINPVQQLARTRDSGRKSSVTQLGHALEAYATVHNGLYVTENATWVTSLVNAGEVATVPGAIAYTAGPTACTNAAENDWCYDYDVANAYVLVYAALESQSEQSKCPNPTDVVWFGYSSADGRGGVICTAGPEPTAGSQTFYD